MTTRSTDSSPLQEVAASLGARDPKTAHCLRANLLSR
jgi:hypothetical protein